MRASLWVVGLTLATLSFYGCAHVQKIDPVYVPVAKEVDIEPGKEIVDGKTISVPYDATYQIKDGVITTHTTAFKVEPLFGADLVGLTASLWAGLRFVHIENVGLDLGFDRSNFTLGVDYLWHDLILGPNIAFPYDLTPEHFGVKGALLF